MSLAEAMRGPRTVAGTPSAYPSTGQARPRIFPPPPCPPPARPGRERGDPPKTLALGETLSFPPARFAGGGRLGASHSHWRRLPLAGCASASAPTGRARAGEE